MLRIDSHRHVGGSILTDFVWSVIQSQNLHSLASSYEDVVKQMVFMPDEPYGFHRFLDKFKILDSIPWTEELIDQSIKSICDGLNTDNIDYAWLDFSINKYMSIGWSQYEAIKFIHNRFENHRPGKIGLILSLKYESDRVSQRRYARLIDDADTAKCLIGIDLVGDESKFEFDFYKPIFSDWEKAGKMRRAHVGESQSADNIKYAIEELNVCNVAHGFKIIDHPDVIMLAKERGITFDLAITSNYLTGVWAKEWHPITYMLALGLKVTLGSDDPVQCNTTLAIEQQKAIKLGVQPSQLQLMMLTANDNSRPFIRLF